MCGGHFNEYLLSFLIRKNDPIEFVDVKKENIDETDGENTSSEVRVTEVR